MAAAATSPSTARGRLVGAWFDGLTYRRALDNRVLLCGWTRRNWACATGAFG
ncbi:MAG: hypothetical protein H6644_12050 [Caldilineaceae bacterium]|nr:hypothetical protein [Caldilineaceae bacterium]